MTNSHSVPGLQGKKKINLTLEFEKRKKNTSDVNVSAEEVSPEVGL